MRVVAIDYDRSENRHINDNIFFIESSKALAVFLESDIVYQREMRNKKGNCGKIRRSERREELKRRQTKWND